MASGWLRWQIFALLNAQVLIARVEWRIHTEKVSELRATQAGNYSTGQQSKTITLLVWHRQL